MIGVNELKLNQATVAAAVQAYLNDGAAKSKHVVVKSVNQTSDAQNFVVQVEPYTPAKRVRKRRAAVAVTTPSQPGVADKT